MEATAISFEDAVKKAYNRNGNLKGYLGYFAYDTNSTILFDDKRVWEFRYKMQYEEPRVTVVNSDDNSLLVSWNKDFVEEKDEATNGFDCRNYASSCFRKFL
jgi:hypothetical protein